MRLTPRDVFALHISEDTDGVAAAELAAENDHLLEQNDRLIRIVRMTEQTSRDNFQCLQAMTDARNVWRTWALLEGMAILFVILVQIVGTILWGR